MKEGPEGRDTAPAGLDGEDRREADARGPDDPADGVDRRTFIRRTGYLGAAGAALGLGGLAAEPGGATEPGPAAESASPGAPYLHQAIPDVAVIGAGAFGAWSAFYLRRKGRDVLLVDKYGPANSKATSGGETRGVRSSYGNRSTPTLWTRWAAESIERWKRYDAEWADLRPAPLFYTTSDLILREEDEPFLENCRKEWDAMGWAYEVLDYDEIRYRWPVIENEYLTLALWEEEAGVVRARRAIETLVRVYEEEGGRLRLAEARPDALSQAGRGRLRELATTGGEPIRAGQYVFALGPWFPKVFPEIMGPKFRIPIGNVVYFGTPPGDDRFTWPNIPSWNVPGCTGWAALPPDHRGFRVRTGGQEPTDPDFSPRWVPQEGLRRPREILREYFPVMADAPVIETRACHYEIPSGRNFIIDRHPGWENAWFAGGGSAEAFKFGPVTGEYVANRVTGDDPGEDEIAEAFRVPERDYEQDEGAWP